MFESLLRRKENLTKAFKLIDQEDKQVDGFLDDKDIKKLIGRLKKYERNPDDSNESKIEVQLSRLGLNGSAMERLISYVNVADDDGKVSVCINALFLQKFILLS